MRSGAGRSDVATTTTERLRPSGPSSFSRNARTSRLRSPTSAITLTSASLCRDIMPSRVLLPTPLPPKMPTRCPLPQGSSPSMARMPVTSGSTMCSRSRGWGGAVYKGYAVEARTGGPSSMRPPESVQHAAQQSRTHAQQGIIAARNHAIAGLQAIRLFQRHRQHAIVAKSDHLRANGAAGSRCALPRNRQSKPPGRARQSATPPSRSLRRSRAALPCPEPAGPNREWTNSAPCATGHRSNLVIVPICRSTRARSRATAFPPTHPGCPARSRRKLPRA